MAMTSDYRIRGSAGGVILGILMATSAQFAAGAADTDGEYYVDEVRIDGSAWTDASTEVEIGTAYAIEIDLSYDRDPGIEFEYEFSDGQQVDVSVGGVGGDTFASTTAAAPATQDQSFTIFNERQVNVATWLLTGTALFEESFGAPGIYDMFFNRTPNSLGAGDGLSPQFASLSQKISVVSRAATGGGSVPIPATAFLMGLGIIALGGLRHAQRQS